MFPLLDTLFPLSLGLSPVNGREKSAGGPRLYSFLLPFTGEGWSGEFAPQAARPRTGGPMQRATRPAGDALSCNLENPIVRGRVIVAALTALAALCAMAATPAPAQEKLKLLVWINGDKGYSGL